MGHCREGLQFSKLASREGFMPDSTWPALGAPPGLHFRKKNPSGPIGMAECREGLEVSAPASGEGFVSEHANLAKPRRLRDSVGLLAWRGLCPGSQLELPQAPLRGFILEKNPLAGARTMVLPLVAPPARAR